MSLLPAENSMVFILIPSTKAIRGFNTVAPEVCRASSSHPALHGVELAHPDLWGDACRMQERFFHGNSISAAQW